MSDLFRNKILPPGKYNIPKSSSITNKPDSLDPLPWSNYFTYKEDLETDVGSFRIYRRGFEGPLLFFLHGGGFSALSWSVLSKCITDEVKCQCLAMDIRGHGDTVTLDDADLSADTLAKDIGRIIINMFPSEAPPIILIGHSMGGAIAIHSAVKSVVPSLVGLVVIDVVEGSALEALYSMNSFLRSRPKTFKSIKHAIEWSLKTGQIRNAESARVSFPGQLKNMTTDLPATRDIELSLQNPGVTLQDQSADNFIPSNSPTVIEEEMDENDELKDSPRNDKELSSHHVDGNNKQTSSSSQYTWRIDLTKTEQYWKGWFQGMSEMFLSISQPKLLILAGIDRMDRDLTIGQMQGKFQMRVIPQSGHAVHEDVPDKVSDCLATFLVRNRFTEAKTSFEKIGC